MEQFKQKIAQLEADNKTLTSELETEKLKVYQREDEIIGLKLENKKLLDQYDVLRQQLTPNQVLDQERIEALYETIKQHKETIERQRRELDLWREYSDKDKKKPDWVKKVSNLHHKSDPTRRPSFGSAANSPLAMSGGSVVSDESESELSCSPQPDSSLHTEGSRFDALISPRKQPLPGMTGTLSSPALSKKPLPMPPAVPKRALVTSGSHGVTSSAQSSPVLISPSTGPSSSPIAITHHTKSFTDITGTSLPSSPSLRDLKVSATEVKVPESGPDMIVENGRIMAATIERLITLLVDPTLKTDQNYCKVFLLTFRPFCPPPDLLRRLIVLWDQASTKWQVHELQLFRIKFIKVLGDWMKEHFYDFTEECVKEVQLFLEDALAKQNPRFYETLKATITKQLENRARKIVRTPNIQPPPPILLTDSPIITDLFQIDPLEFARQMTLRDEEVYRKIKPRELMNQAYSQKDVAQLISPNVVQLISRFNLISTWVQTAIVKETQYKRRKKTLSRFIKIAGKLRDINNFHSMMAIVLGVMSPPVSRLKKTWEGVTSANMKTYEELQQICHPAKNHEALRTALKLIVPPCVPWLGLYLRDLTFADENKNIWPSEDDSVELVNLEKLRLVSTLIHDATFFQVDYYNLTVVPEIQDYLTYGESQILSTKELDEWSLKAEPKTM